MIAYIFNNNLPRTITLLDKKEDYHVHSSYNDHSASDLTIKNAIDRAEKIGLRTMAVTEHIRRTSAWVPQYLEELRTFGKSSKVNVISGFEAKILSDGSIDCLEKYSGKHMIVASFHTSYPDKKIWLGALSKAVENPHVNTIGHLAPEPTFSLSRLEIESLAAKIAENEKIVEINAKYHRPPSNWIIIFRDSGVKFRLGSDAHSVSEIGQFDRISDLISLVGKK